MLFSSYTFLFFFLPVALGGFCLIARSLGPRPAKLWLSIASLVFYGWWNPKYVVLILTSMVFNYWLGRLIGIQARSSQNDRGRAWLWLGVTANLLLLGYYKYANFFVDSLNSLLGSHWELARVLLPLGISFFTFTQIAYLVDARRGVACEYSFADFLLFITFFPHLIAGPIIHHSEMMPQFAEPRTYRFDWMNLASGVGLFALGLFKKVVIADELSVHAIKVFGAAGAGTALHVSDAWAGVIAYTFQIYFDFSGYSDMAIALARMFGITLPENFNSPYRALNLSDFWRRWHMTLSRFLRDYLYIPLGGNRGGEFKRYRNLILTMTLGGLWHGAAWTFVAWGVFHGAGLAIHHAWQRFQSTTPVRTSWIPQALTPWISRAVTFLFVIVGWVLFRSANLGTAGHILSSMAGGGLEPAAGAPLLLKTKTWYWLVALLVFVWCFPNTSEIARVRTADSEPTRRPGGDWRDRIRWEPSTAWACTAGLLLAFSILGLSRAGEFLYYNF